MRKQYTILIVCLLLLSMLLTACGPETNADTVKVTGVSISGTGVNNGTLSAWTGGRDVPLTATVRPSNATDKTVTWSSSDDKVVTVSGEGLLTIVGEGTATVTAKAGDVSDSIEVTVKATVSATSLSMNSESYTIVVPTNDPATFDLSGEITIEPADANNKTVLWSVKPQDSAVTVNAQGVVIVSPSVDINAVYTVTATSAENSALSASATLTFTHNQATGIVVRLSSNGAQKPASYVYEFSLDDKQFEHLFFVAETRPVGSVGACTFVSSNPDVCDIVAVDATGNAVETSGQAKLDIKSVGEATITVSVAGTEITKDVLIKINPEAGYIFEDLNVTADELQDTVDTTNWWDFNFNPTPKDDSLFFSVQEPTGNLGLFYHGLDGTEWSSKMNPNQGNGAYVEDGGYCVVFTAWDWPLDNDQTNCYIFNTVHTPAAATTFRLQIRTQSGTYQSGMAKFRVRLVDKEDPTNYIFLDVNGQTADGFTPLEGRSLEDMATYKNGAFDPETGWIIIPGVPDYNIGEDIFFCTIPEEWRDRDVILFVENDALHEDDGYGNMVEGKCDIMLICSMGFVSNANDTAEFSTAE